MIVITKTSMTAQPSRLMMKTSMRLNPPRSQGSAQVGEVLPPAECYGLAARADFDARALLAAADHGEPERVRRGREQLVVLAEADVLLCRAFGERDALELDRDLAPGTIRDVGRVGREAVRDVEQRVSDGGQAAAFLEPQRRACMTAFPERRAGGAERPGDDQQVAGPGTVAPGNTLGAADRRDREIDRRRLSRVPADDRYTWLVQALVELEDVLERGVAGDSERDEQALGNRPRRGEV